MHSTSHVFKVTLQLVMAATLVCAATLAALAESPEANQPKLTFQQALQHALRDLSAYDAVTAASVGAELTAKNAWRSMLPALDAQASHIFEQPSGGPYATNAFTMPSTLGNMGHGPWSNSLSLGISEKLYDNGEAWRTSERADLAAEAARLDQQRGRLQTLLDAAKSFYDYSLASASAELQRSQLEFLRKQFRTIESRYRQGITSNRDYIRIKTEVERGEIGSSSQQISLEESRKNLRNLIGARDAVDFLPYLPDERALEALSVSNAHPQDTFEFRIASAQDKISQSTVRSAEREAWPRLSLSGSYSWFLPQYVGGRGDGDQFGTDLKAMIVVDWSIWDWGIRRRKVEIAEAKRRSEFDGREAIRIRVTHDLTRLQANAATLLRQHLLTHQVLRDVETAYNAVSAAYRDGKTAYLDLSTALNDLFSSRTQHLQIQFDLLKARADLAYYQGNLDEVLEVR